MKKTLLSMTAALAVIGAANAGIKETCLEHPDKLVWVEKTQRCIPINPCKSDDETIQVVYCNVTFAKIQLGSIAQGQKLVEAYLANNMNVAGSYVGNRHRDTSLLGQDFIPYELNDGGYVVFEFDDLSDITESQIADGAMEGACYVFNGSYYLNPGYCAGLENEKSCESVAELATEVSGQVIHWSWSEKEELLSPSSEVTHTMKRCVLTVVD
ncbi:MAG: hypothetical protein II179_02815 [Alphaproteobacteria bacterium]|nr:hypothetical protein [Alphaproteobacteria bacterium]